MSEQPPVHPYPRKKRRNYGPARSAKNASKAALALNKRGKLSEEEMSAAGRALHSRRYSMMSKKERSAQARAAARAYWDSMSEEERKLEMKRRHRIMRKRRMDARLARIRQPEQQ